MSKYLVKSATISGLGVLIPTVLGANVARSQSKNNAKDPRQTLPNAAEINKKIQQNYPPELLEDGQTASPKQSPGGANSLDDGTTANSNPSPTVPSITSAPDNTTAVGSAKYTFVLSTPALIAIVVIVGGLALFPVIHLLLNSKKAAEIRKNSIWSKWLDRFQKPKVLESDAFLHHRNFEKINQIADRVENIDADKFSNTEFTEFFKIKSYIARSANGYDNLDEIIECFHVAIGAQGSFARIDSIESKNCSTNQQELYKFVNGLFAEEVDSQSFKEQINLKYQEILPRLKSEEGKVALQAYVEEAINISQHPLAVKLLLLFKKYQFDDYSILRSVANTINLLESEDLLNLDSLMLLVMEKYDVFEKLGPIVGVSPENNRPETYSKMLQYIGLKTRHEVSYQKFQEFLKLLKTWEIHYQTVVNVRQKYAANEYRLPKDFTAELPGKSLYLKYKDSFHLIAETKQTKSIEMPNTVKSSVTDPSVLTGVS